MNATVIAWRKQTDTQEVFVSAQDVALWLESTDGATAKDAARELRELARDIEGRSLPEWERS